MAKQLLQLRSLGEIACTYEEIQEGMPEEPPSVEMDLIAEEFKGKELDPIIKQASEEFLADNNFVTTGSFMQFFWKQNIEKFKAKCEKRKSEQPHKDASTVRKK